MDICNLPCSEGKDQLALPLAVPYVRRQMWEEPMEPCRSLCAGTVFASLSLPLSGYCCKCDANCLENDGCACRKGREI